MKQYLPISRRTVSLARPLVAILLVGGAGCAAVNANMSREHIQAWSERTVPTGTPLAEATRRIERSRLECHMSPDPRELVAEFDAAWWYAPIAMFTWQWPYGRIHFPLDEDDRVVGASVEIWRASP